MVTVNYNRELDILTVQRKEYEDFDRSIELGGYVLDLDTDSQFLGLEIIDASQNTPLDRDDLAKIHDANINLVKTDEYLRIEIRFSIDNHQNMISSQYPASVCA